MGLVCFGCHSPLYIDRNHSGADEFVMDSYKIQQGKFSILEMEGKIFDEIPAEYFEEYQDTIHDGDILFITLFHPTRADLSKAVADIGASIGFHVQGGNIRLPDLGLVSIAHLTLEEAAQKIESLYRSQTQEVQVYLSYKRRQTHTVELCGCVSTVSVPIDGRLRLFDVLSKAKILPNANLFKSYILRENQTLAIDLFKLLKEGDMSQNIVMRGGDKIYIAEPSAATLMVLGEVRKEILIDVPNGFLTIWEAIAQAGGILSTGNKSFIQVIRGNIHHPKIYTLTWDHIIHLPTSSMLLIPGDIVYVTATPPCRVE